MILLSKGIVTAVAFYFFNCFNAKSMDLNKIKVASIISCLSLKILCNRLYHLISISIMSLRLETFVISAKELYCQIFSLYIHVFCL